MYSILLGFMYLYIVKKVELEIINITQGFTQHHSYAVVLGEVKGKRRLPIVIGTAEAQSIASAIENMTPARPLTHDLMKNVMDTFHVFLSEIVIYNLMEGVFYSKLICIFNGEEHEIDSRTSDAIAMAVRFGCPIYIYSSILENAGILLVEEEQEEQDEFNEPTENPFVFPVSGGDYGNMTLAELEEILNDALANEDYEKAATIRDEIKKKQEE